MHGTSTFFLCFWIALIFPQPLIAKPVIMAQGQTLTRPARSSTIHIADPSIIKVQSVGGRIILTAKKIGQTTIRWSGAPESFIVVSDETLLAWKTLSPIVATMRGLSLDITNSEVIVRGRLLRLADWQTLSDLRMRFHLQTSMTSELSTAVEKNIREQLKNQGLPQVSVQITPEAIAWVQALKTHQHLQAVLAKLGVKLTERSGTISADPIVEVSILIAEVRRKSMLSAGWKILGTMEAQLLPTFSAGGVKAQLELLQSNGEAQVLASPTLICKSGKEAKFLAGGEFPIKMMNVRTSNVVWKPYGVMMAIKPLVDGEGRIHLSLATEVSSLDFSQTVDGVPSILSHRVSTEFDLNRSQTIAISGLIRKETSEEQTGVPLLRSLPILGPLFGSTAFQKGESELVIFVTPKVKGEDNDAQR